MQDFIINYVRDRIDGEFDPELDDLIDFLDSVVVVQLNLALEREFNIQLPMKDLDVDDYETVDSLAKLVEQRRQPVPQG